LPFQDVEIIVGSTNGDGLVDFGPFLQNPEEEYNREQSQQQ
jgi:hypothetical protein